jgi:hypothetical protein
MKKIMLSKVYRNMDEYSWGAKYDMSRPKIIFMPPEGWIGIANPAKTPKGLDKYVDQFQFSNWWGGGDYIFFDRKNISPYEDR